MTATQLESGLGSGPEPIAVLASRVRADEKRIFEAFERRNVPYVHFDTRDTWIWSEKTAPPWSLVFNREIGLNRAVHAAWALEGQGLSVVNSAAATDLCGNKWRTTLAFRQQGIPTPRTALALTPDAALAAMDGIGYPVVVKPVTGSWGRLVTPIPDRATGQIVLEYIQALPNPQSHIVYVQDLIPKPERDIRIVVVGGRAVGAMYRQSTHWRTNVARGGQAPPAELTPELSSIACAAAAAVGADLAGVDLIEDQDGALSVLEVNGGVEFSGFHAAHDGKIDLASEIVDFLIRRADTVPVIRRESGRPRVPLRAEQVPESVLATIDGVQVYQEPATADAVAVAHDVRSQAAGEIPPDLAEAVHQ